MRRKVFLGVFVLVAAVAIGFLFFDDARTGRVAGRKVGFWLDEMNAGGARSNAAVAVFLREGSAAVPALTNELRFVSPVRTNFIRLKAHLPWAVASRLPRAPRINYLRRYSAIYALQALGPQAKAGVPALLAAVTAGDMEELMMPGNNGGMMVGQAWSHGLRAVALDALTRIDPENLDHLTVAAVLAVEFGTPRGPWAAAMGVAYQAALRALEAADHPDARTIERILTTIRGQEREAYFITLGSFVAAAAPNRGLGMSMEVLFCETNTLAALESKTAKFREAAAFELGDPRREGWNGHQEPGLKISERGVVALVEALKDSEARVRLNAAETLVKWGRREGDGEVAGVLAGLLEATNSLVRLRAVDNLKRMGPRAQGTLGKLREAEKSDVGIVRVWAKEAVGEIVGMVSQKETEKNRK